MSEHAFQILLVVVGGLIGLVSSLIAAWLTSRRAAVHHRKDRVARIHELIGTRCALRGSDPQEEEEVWSEWLKTNDASRLDRVAFMVGFFETNTMQLQKVLQECSNRETMLADAEAEKVTLQREVDFLVQEKDALESKRDALETQKRQLEEKANPGTSSQNVAPME